MAFKLDDDADSMSDINVTPLVDVMLVLLVIFMVTAPLLHQGVEVQLPKSVSQNLSKTPEDPLILSITKNQVYYLNETPIPKSQLRDRLQDHPAQPARQGRLPEGRPQPRVRRRGRDHGHAEPAGRGEPRHGDRAEERGQVTPARVLTVSDILAQRAHAGEPSRTVAVVVSILAHASFLIGLALVSRPRPTPFVPTAIRVGVVNPSLFEKPAPMPQAAPAPPPVPVPETAKPEPKKGPPVIEKVKPDLKASAKAMPDLKSAKKKPEKEVTAPRPAPVAGPAIELPTSPAAGGGNAGPGTLAFGTSVAGLDVDFPFAYYVDQLLQLIGANWLKPSVPDGTSCVVTFRVLRSGQITDVKLETTSTLPFYDRAAARAVYSANPLPPLPQEFAGDTLGVHLKFQ